MSKFYRLSKFIFIALAFALFLQGLGVIDFIPVKFITGLLGVTNDPLSLFISAFYVVIFVFVGSIFAEIFYSFGLKRNGAILNRIRIFTQGFIAFLTVWITFFSYGILAVLGILPKIVDPDKILNLYLCWYILINLSTRVNNKKGVRVNVVNNRNTAIDVDRVTWWSHITRLNTALEFKGEKGKAIFKQGNVRNISFVFIVLLMLWMVLPIFKILGSFLFLPVNPPELTFFVRIMISFFIFVSSVPVIGMLGVILSRGIIVYKKCICLPLATFSDKPLFTLLLPRSSVLLGFDDVESFEIKKGKYKQSDEEYISSVKFTMKNGDRYVFEPSVEPSFEKVLVSAIGEQKRVE